MASVNTHSFLKSRLFNVKFHFPHKIWYLKSRCYVKLRFVKSRLYCTVNLENTNYLHTVDTA